MIPSDKFNFFSATKIPGRNVGTASHTDEETASAGGGKEGQMMSVPGAPEEIDMGEGHKLKPRGMITLGIDVIKILDD